MGTWGSLGGMEKSPRRGGVRAPFCTSTESKSLEQDLLANKSIIKRCAELQMWTAPAYRLAEAVFVAAAAAVQQKRAVYNSACHFLCLDTKCTWPQAFQPLDTMTLILAEPTQSHQISLQLSPGGRAHSPWSRSVPALLPTPLVNSSACYHVASVATAVSCWCQTGTSEHQTPS